MGLIDRVKGQFIDIVEFLDDSRDTLVWRFPRQGNEIKNGAQLVVREAQAAVFENEGQIADSFLPGTYTLETKNLPILSDLKGWKYGFNSPFKAEVYFVGTRQYTDMKWGTAAPIPMTDPKFGLINLRANGSYALQITDPIKLIRQLVGTDPNFSTDEVEEFLRSLIVSHVGPGLAAANLSFVDLINNQQTIAATLAGTLTTSLADYGITIPRFIIESVTPPPEVTAAMNKLTSMNVIGNLDQYAKFQSANAVEDAAKNTGSAGGALGMGLGIGLGQQAASALNQPGAAPAPPAAAAAPAAPTGPPPIPGAAIPYFIAVNGQQVGPVAVADMPAKITSGELTPTSLVWHQGMDKWTAASELPDLAPLFPVAPPPLPPQA